MKTRHAAFRLLLLLIFSFSSFSCKKKSSSPSVSGGSGGVSYEKVSLNKFRRSVDIQGYLEPMDIQKVQFRGTGAITGVYVKEGQKVKKGDLLATIDDTKQRYEYVKAQQEVEIAEKSLSRREKDLLELQLKNAENNLSYTKATALFDGVVIKVNIQEGDYAEAGTTLDLIQVVDVSSLKATVLIDEIDMRIIKKGMKVNLDFDSVNRSVEAYVSYVPYLASYDSSSGIGVKEVELMIDNPPDDLYPGYTFSATISGEEDDAYLMLPNAAVRSQRGQSYVIRKNSDGSEEKVNVSVRYLGEGLSQLLSGKLSEGDVVVVNKGRTATEKMQNSTSGGMPAGGGRF